ncbi:MAG: hypothetical protein M3280_06125, partial [Actinomycetota bacterium]|nr:hypothetical protein [Actinomycetota bacterium]
MERAWPFENKPEPVRRLKSPEDFVARYGDGAEAVCVRIGLHDAQVVLVDREGRWDRWVYHSLDEAKEIAENLGVPVHIGEFPEETRVRMNAYQRPAADFDAGAYPEQGHVGPVIEYPENRPRRIDALRKEVDRDSRSGPS